MLYYIMIWLQEIEYKYLIVEGSGESVKRWEADGYVSKLYL